MIPGFDINGNLPPGIHVSTWDEFEQRFGMTEHRRSLLSGLKEAIGSLKISGCKRIFIGGSFVTSKLVPNDYDCCWDMNGVNPDILDPVFFDLRPGRISQKIKYKGEFLPAQFKESVSGKLFIEFFSSDKDGNEKGIILLNFNEDEKNDQE